MTKTKKLIEGDKVYITGEVNYGDQWYRVASSGVIIKSYVTRALVCIDEIDGDRNANVLVHKSMIKI